MKKLYASKLFWTGIIAAVIAAGDYATVGGDWKTVVLAVIGVIVIGFRIVTTEKVTLTGKGAASATLPIVLVLALGCSAVLNDLPISGKQKVAIAIEAGCAAAASAGCFGKSDEVKQIFGPLKTFGECVSKVSDAVSNLHIGIDIGRLTAKRFTCRKFYKAITSDRSD